MSLVLGLLIGVVITYILEQILQKNKKLRKEFWEHHKPIFGYHVHHNVLGIPFIVLGIYCIFHPIFHGWLFIGIGLGIIIWHSYTAKHFAFIEKSNKERKNQHIT